MKISSSHRAGRRHLARLDMILWSRSASAAARFGHTSRQRARPVGGLFGATTSALSISAPAGTTVELKAAFTVGATGRRTTSPPPAPSPAHLGVRCWPCAPLHPCALRTRTNTLIWGGRARISAALGRLTRVHIYTSTRRTYARAALVGWWASESFARVHRTHCAACACAERWLWDVVC